MLWLRISLWDAMWDEVILHDGCVYQSTTQPYKGLEGSIVVESLPRVLV